MELNNKDKTGYESDKVVGLLSPKYPRKNSFSYKKPRRRISNKIWAMSGIAAMFVVIITIAINSTIPASAAEIINSGLSELFNAGSVRVEFTLHGVKTAKDEIYKPDINGEIVEGTVYILNKDGKVYNRIDWHDADRNSIIFKDGRYIHLRNGNKVGEHPCGDFNELLEIINLSSLRRMAGNILNEAEIVSDGNYITVQHRKRGSDILFTGKFRKDNNQLSEASVHVKDSKGTEKTILKTNAIDINIDIPDALFEL